MRNYAKILYKIFKQHMFWIFVRIAISKIYALRGNRNKTRPFFFIILSIKDSLQQQKFIIMAIFLGTNVVVVMRVHCTHFLCQFCLVLNRVISTGTDHLGLNKFCFQVIISY